MSYIRMFYVPYSTRINRKLILAGLSRVHYESIEVNLFQGQFLLMSLDLSRLILNGQIGPVN